MNQDVTQKPVDTYQPQIRPVGPIPARIMLIGECPGEKEIEKGEPFVGPAGRVLDSILEEVGIVRAQCYITNVVLTRPPNNNFEVFYDKGKPTPELNEAVKRLWDEVRTVNPNVIVCLGNEAFKAVTGIPGVSDWRGSVVKAALWEDYKVIPVYHPAAIAREWTFRAPTICDFQKVLQESAYREIRTTKRELVVPKTIEEALTHLNWIKDNAKEIAFDIETETNQVTAIAFAPQNRPNWSVCIPFWFGQSGSLWKEEEEVKLWELIERILTDSGIGKIAHNGAYDTEFLQRTMGFNVHPLVFDTMVGFHALYLELPKNLGFVSSIYTDHPYYKHQLKSTSMDTFFKYNATDACLTMEIADKIREDLRDDGLMSFYEQTIHPLIEVLLDMQRIGVKFDYLKRNSVKKHVQEEIAVLQRNLDNKVGRPLNVNSPKQMKEWLYGDAPSGGLGLKVKLKKRKGQEEATVAADEEALEALYEESGNDALRIVLKIREKQKLLSTYLEVSLDEDKRIRCSYLITGTETGRLSSRSTARGTGTNLQNVPPGVVRSLFVPDDGKVFINADLSQAEARVVAYIANEPRLIRVFEEGGDIHRKNAANVFGISEEQVTDEQRQLAKRVVHASNYGMGPITFSRTAGIPVAESKRLLNQYFATYPGIANWHVRIGDQLKRTKSLTTPLGRKRTFFNRFDLKEGLAYIPQSTVADILNNGLVELWRRRHEIAGLDILLQVHDSILVQVSQEGVEGAVALIKEALTRPLEINGRIMTIPCDFKVGRNWDDMEKWKGA